MVKLQFCTSAVCDRASSPPRTNAIHLSRQGDMQVSALVGGSAIECRFLSSTAEITVTLGHDVTL